MMALVIIKGVDSMSRWNPDHYDQLARDLTDRGHSYITIAEMCTKALMENGDDHPLVQRAQVRNWLRRYLNTTEEPTGIKARLVLRTARKILAKPILDCVDV
jgi:hypothetical protein